MALTLRIGQLIGACTAEHDDLTKVANRILSKVDKGMTERERLELVQVLTRLNFYAEDYQEDIPEKDIIEFVQMIKVV